MQLSLFLWYHLFVGCGEYMADQLDQDFWLLTNERYPDFKQKNTCEALWAEDRWNSPWVAAEIAAKALVRAGRWSMWYVCVGWNGFFATKHLWWFDVVWGWHVQFGFYDWTREFWWILAWHNDQQEIILTTLRMPITWRCASPQVKNIPATGCFYNLSLLVYRWVLIT